MVQYRSSSLPRLGRSEWLRWPISRPGDPTRPSIPGLSLSERFLLHFGNLKIALAKTSSLERQSRSKDAGLKTTISTLNRRDTLWPWDPEYQLLVTAGTLSRGPCKSKAKRFASTCTFPITLTEQGLLADNRRGCFNETLDVGAPHSLTVSLLLLLLPTLLSVKSFGHDAGQLLALQYQTCCACRLNIARARRPHWTRIAQVSATVDYCFSFSR